MKSRIIISLIVITGAFTACSKNDSSTKVENTRVLNYSQVIKPSKADTFSLKVDYNCNNGFNSDTCIVQRIGDTIRLYGKINIICDYTSEIIEEKADTIFINWNPKMGAICNVCMLGCFDIKIPDATNYSLVIFNGKTYNCGNDSKSYSSLLSGKWNIVKDSVCALIGPTMVQN